MGEFKSDLAWSNSQDPFVVESVKLAFPQEPQLYVDFSPREKSGKQDIDVVLPGKVKDVRLSIDYKLSKGPWTGFVTLEDVSSDRGWTPGWTHRCFAYDYILYLWPVSLVHMLLPGPAMHRAWFEHRLQWVRQYKYTIGENPTYNTLCVKVPMHVLTCAMEPYAPRCASGCGRIVGKYSTACSVCGVKTCCQGMGTWTCASPACKK